MSIRALAAITVVMGLGGLVSAADPDLVDGREAFRIDDSSVHLYSMFGESSAVGVGPATSSVALVLPAGVDAHLDLPEELSYEVETEGVVDAGTARRVADTVTVPIAESIRDAGTEGGTVRVTVMNTDSADGVPDEPGAYLRVVEDLDWRGTDAATEPTVPLGEHADTYDVFTFPDSAAPVRMEWGEWIAVSLPEGVSWRTGPGSWEGLVPSATLYWDPPAGTDAEGVEYLDDSRVGVGNEGLTMRVRLPSGPPEGWSDDGRSWMSFSAQDDVVPGHSVQVNVAVALADAPTTGVSTVALVLAGSVLVCAGAMVGYLVIARRRRSSTPS